MHYPCTICAFTSLIPADSAERAGFLPFGWFAFFECGFDIADSAEGAGHAGRTGRDDSGFQVRHAGQPRLTGAWVRSVAKRMVTWLPFRCQAHGHMVTVPSPSARSHGYCRQAHGHMVTVANATMFAKRHEFNVTSNGTSALMQVLSCMLV
jgi:hypothetical protein